MASFSFSIVPASCLSKQTILDCIDLYHSHGYGESQFLEHCFADDLRRGFLVTARSEDGTLVGYCTSSKSDYACFDDVEVPVSKHVIWITQLAVHSSFRNLKVGTRLCRHSIAAHFTDEAACAIVSCEPYAVRCLEAALGKSCSTSVILRHAASMAAQSRVKYIYSSRVRSTRNCVVSLNTRRVSKCAHATDPYTMPEWKLGILQDGHEFIAVVQQ